MNFKFNGIPQHPTKTKSNDSDKNVTLAAFKETQNIEIASRTIKNEAEIKLARIGEILDPNFRKKSLVNGPDFLSRGIFLFLNGFSRKLENLSVSWSSFGFYFWFFNAIVR